MGEHLHADIFVIRQHGLYRVRAERADGSEAGVVLLQKDAAVRFQSLYGILEFIGA